MMEVTRGCREETGLDCLLPRSHIPWETRDGDSSRQEEGRTGKDLGF